MRIVGAILLLIVLLTIALGIATRFDITWVLTGIIVVGSSLWAAWDTWKINRALEEEQKATGKLPHYHERLRFGKYTSGLWSSPGHLFIACLLLWFVFFPWYLLIRHEVQKYTSQMSRRRHTRSSMAVYRKRNRADLVMLIVSLVVHIAVAMWLSGYDVSRHFRQIGSAISVDWVEDVPEPKLKRSLPKKPIEKKFDPTRDPTVKSKKKLSRASPHKIALVKEWKDKPVQQTVQEKGKRRETIPDIMTAAQVRDSYTTVSDLASTNWAEDGRGVVSNETRAAGHGKDGLSVLGLDGVGDGLAGGGGGGGILDPFGIIKSLNESGGRQRVVYCLDVSASMSMGAKLRASISSLKQSMLQLGDFDEFNIVTFHSGVKSFKKEAIPATMENIEKARRFLDSFTPRSIENNLGTDILGALRYALRMRPAVIVLITDIQPTRGEVDEERIAEEVKKLNRNDARIYGIGVEVWEPSPTGRLAKLLKILTEQNGGEMRLSSSG